MPATFFLATGAILRGEEFWWDQVEAAFLRPVDVPAELDLPIGAARWRWYASTDRREAFLRLLVEMRKADPADRRAAITRLRLWSSTTPATRETHRPLTASEVAVLASIGGMAIGAHTVEHALLASQHEACLRREVEASRDHVTELAGVRPTAFAYPFGGRRQFDHRAARLVRSAGFAFACSTRSDRVWRGSGRWKLPRIAVRNWDVDEFARRLAHDAGWA